MRDPRGHSFGGEDVEPRPLGQTWDRRDDYLYAVDLFNAGFYWEAHEALEPFWRAAGRESDDGRFLQGWIQVCAALLKHQMGEAHAAARLLARARANFGSDERFGVRPARLLADVEALLAGGDAPVRVRLERPG